MAVVGAGRLALLTPAEVEDIIRRGLPISSALPQRLSASSFRVSSIQC